jgi:hypothetical protein
MNNIGFIEFTYGKIKYFVNAVSKCESIYLAHVLFYFIWNVVTKSRIPKNGTIRMFDDKSKLKEDAFSYSYATIEIVSIQNNVYSLENLLFPYICIYIFFLFFFTNIFFREFFFLFISIIYRHVLDILSFISSFQFNCVDARNDRHFFIHYFEWIQFQ